MASVVGKTIFSNGKGKLFFGYYKTDDAVEFVDYKTWKKLSFKDVSKGDTNKERVIKAIVKNQKQFNKKVDFNMWAKKQKRSFEDTMDWFIQNGWINNINKGGIKESVDVLSVNEDRNSNMFYVLYQKKGVFGKPAAAGYKDRKDAEKFAKSLGNNHNTMILDKQSMKNVKGVDVKEGKKRFKRQDGIGKAKYTVSYHDGKKKHKDGSDFFDIKIFKNKKDLSDFVGTLTKQGYKLTRESVNESAGKEAMGIAALTGTRGSAVQDFIDKNRINSRKLFNALKKANLQGRINFANGLAGKPGNPNAKLTIKLFGESVNEAKFGYKTSTASYINKHKDEYKQAEKMNKGNEKRFYDMLQQMEEKVGHGKTMLFISNALRGYGVDMFKDPKIKNPQDAQEALFLLSK